MNSRRFLNVLPAVLFLCATSLTACASKHGAPAATDADDTNDPYENINRDIFDVNLTLDKYFFKPIAIGYRDATPQFVQTGLTNIFNNLRSPAILMNDLLQGNMELAGQTFGRIFVNTTLGVGGIFDVAGNTSDKMPLHEADFGQTLGVWGVNSGPYLMLPLLGPSNPRDAIGFGVDSLADPFAIEMQEAHLGEANYVRTGVGLVNSRAQNIDTLDEVQRGSLDFYATVRSLYQQKRAADVARAKAPNAQGTPNISYDPDPKSGESSTPVPVTGSDKAK